MRAFAANNIISSRRTCPWMVSTLIFLFFVSIVGSVVGHVARLPGLGYSLVTILLPASSAHGFKGLREGDNQAWGVYCPAGTPLPQARAKETEAITFFGTCETRCSVLGLRDGKKLPPCCEDSCHAGRREKKKPLAWPTARPTSQCRRRPEARAQGGGADGERG